MRACFAQTNPVRTPLSSLRARWLRAFVPPISVGACSAVRRRAAPHGRSVGRSVGRGRRFAPPFGRLGGAGSNGLIPMSMLFPINLMRELLDGARFDKMVSITHRFLSCLALFCFALLCYASPWPALLCSASLCLADALLCFDSVSFAMPCYALLCYAL